MRSDGRFAIGYKFVEERKTVERVFLGSDCGSHACDNTSLADWKYWINTVRGFADLTAAMKANASDYPKHANVIMVGDAGDALSMLIRVRADIRKPSWPSKRLVLSS